VSLYTSVAQSVQRDRACGLLISTVFKQGRFLSHFAIPEQTKRSRNQPILSRIDDFCAIDGEPIGG
jgi:hypothetical protein